MNTIKDKDLDYTHPKIQKLIGEIIEILKKSLNIPFKLYIFGSFASGRATYTSDLDLALETEGDLSYVEFIKLKEELYDNLRTLRKIDFIYLNKSPEKVKNLVKKEGIVIYESGREDRIT